MECSEMKKIFRDYTNGLLPPDQRKLAEEHLSYCSSCKTALNSYNMVRERLNSLHPAPAMTDQKDLIMQKINTVHTKKQALKWARPVLVAVPTVAIMLALFLLQPWSPANGPTTVMAMEQLIEQVKITTSMDYLKSCRVTVYESAAIDSKGNIQNSGDKYDFEFAGAPSSVHLKISSPQAGTIDEFISILSVNGATNYYLESNSISLGYNDMVNKSGGGVPSKAKTLGLLQGMRDIKSDIQQLPDEVIDGVDCLHYQGISGGQFGTNYKVPSEFWIGKDDYIIRQITQKLPEQEGTPNVFIIKYYDFNAPITVEAPATASGEPLAGWVKAENTSSGFHLQIPKKYMIEHDTIVNPYYARVTFPTAWIFDPPKNSEWGDMYACSFLTWGIEDGLGRNPLPEYLNEEWVTSKMIYPVPGSDIPAVAHTFGIEIGEEESTVFTLFVDPGTIQPYLYNVGEIIKLSGTGMPMP